MQENKELLFEVVEDALFVANGGRPFSRTGVISACAFHLSDNSSHAHSQEGQCRTHRRARGNMWPSLRDFLQVPGELTGRNVRIAVVDGEFPNRPDISTNQRRMSYLVPGMSEPETRPQVFTAEPGPWKGGWHALCAAAAAGGSGAESGGFYTGVAPEADLFLVAMYSREPGWEGEKAHIKALEWVRANWRKYEIRGVLSARKSQVGSGVLPWQTDRRRILCEELAGEGLLVVSGSGNRPDETTAIAEASAPSVLSVGGVAIPPDGDPNRTRMYQGCRGTTFEGKWVPDILAPAENVVLPHRNDEEIETHYYRNPLLWKDRRPAGPLCPNKRHIFLGAGAFRGCGLCVAGASGLDSQ